MVTDSEDAQPGRSLIVYWNDLTSNSFALHRLFAKAQACWMVDIKHGINRLVGKLRHPIY